MRRVKRLIVLLVIFCLALFAEGCTNQNTPAVQTLFLMDTVVTVSVYGPKAEQLLEEAMALCAQYERTWSKTVADSDIARINSAQNQFVAVQPETVALLKEGVHYGDLSGGAFDVTLGAAINLWDFNAEATAHKLPAPDALSAAAATADYTGIVFDGNNVRLTQPEAQIDLGGIAKGLIADKTADYLKKEGALAALINLGGNIQTVGQKPDGTPWLVGIQSPFSETGTALAALSLPEASVVSSGVYERYFELDGRRYHHILDPSTGYPAETGLLSVTVLSKRSLDGDALSTTAFVYGLEKGMALIESLPDTEALFVTETKEIHCSSGLGGAIPVQLLDEGYTLRYAAPIN